MFKYNSYNRVATAKTRGRSQKDSSQVSVDPDPRAKNGARGPVCVGGQEKGGFAKLTNASFSSTAKFKDRVDILSNITKAEASAGQGSKPEGECAGVHAVRLVSQSLTFPALSTRGLAKKRCSPTRICCYYWSQMAAIITQQKSIDVQEQRAIKPSPQEPGSG